MSRAGLTIGQRHGTPPLAARCPGRCMKATPRRNWTLEDFERLAAFPRVNTADLARELGRTPLSVARMARSLGLRKEAEYSTRFQPGQTSWLKGRKGWKAGGRSASTRFKAGRPAHEARNYVPIGSYRIAKAGYLEQKTTDNPRLASARRWVGVHRLVWQAAHGPVPAGHVVAFRRGRHTVELERITLDALELITRAELMSRNTMHNLPPEVSQLIQLRGALNRKIRNRTKAHEKPNAGRA